MGLIGMNDMLNLLQNPLRLRRSSSEQPRIDRSIERLNQLPNMPDHIRHAVFQLSDDRRDRIKHRLGFDEKRVESGGEVGVVDFGEIEGVDFLEEGLDSGGVGLVGFLDGG